jgi:hypothetical protein
MLRIFLSVITAAIVVASAPAAEREAAKGVEVKFLAQVIPNDLGKVVLANADSRSEPFDLSMNNLSPAQVPPARLFSVWSVEKNVSLATVQLPEEGGQFICLLLLKPGEPGYTTVLMPAADPKFKAGDVYFFNNANKPVLGFLGTAKFALNPGKSAVVTPRGGKERFYRIGLGVSEPEGNRLIKTMKWPKSKQTRYYVFFYVDPVKNRVTYRAVDEFIIPLQPKE